MPLYVHQFATTDIDVRLHNAAWLATYYEGVLDLDLGHEGRE